MKTRLLLFPAIIALLCMSCMFKNPAKTEDNRLPAPIIDKVSGTYYAPLLINASCTTENAAIRYTVDGTIPGENSALYSASIPIICTTTLKIRAFKDGFKPSETIESNYNIISPPQPSMVLVEGGSFIMGNTHSNGNSSETPFHRVTLSSFYLDKFEVSQAMFREIMGFNQSYFTGDSLRPAEQISWYDAIEFCNKRSLWEGYEPCYTYTGFGTDCNTWPYGWNSDVQNNITCNWTANGYRLPTEAEWEYAAKGGSQSLSYEYAGSSIVDDVSWFSPNSDGITHPIGLKLPNELGLYDLSGNVWEWCWDWATSYTTANTTNPHGADNGTYRSLRGGSWYYNASFQRVNLRGMVIPAIRYLDIGVRCARTAN